MSIHILNGNVETPNGKPWREEARRLLADGLSPNEIGRRLKKKTCDVKYTLDIDGEKARVWRNKLYNQTYYGLRPRKKVAEARPPRAIPRPVPIEEKRAAWAAYLAGEIDRFEMGRRMVPA